MEKNRKLWIKLCSSILVVALAFTSVFSSPAVIYAMDEEDAGAAYEEDAGTVYDGLNNNPNYFPGAIYAMDEEDAGAAYEEVAGTVYDGFNINNVYADEFTYFGQLFNDTPDFDDLYNTYDVDYLKGIYNTNSIYDFNSFYDTYNTDIVNGTQDISDIYNLYGIDNINDIFGIYNNNASYNNDGNNNDAGSSSNDSSSNNNSNDSQGYSYPAQATIVSNPISQETILQMDEEEYSDDEEDESTKANTIKSNIEVKTGSNSKKKTANDEEDLEANGQNYDETDDEEVDNTKKQETNLQTDEEEYSDDETDITDATKSDIETKTSHNSKENIADDEEDLESNGQDYIETLQEISNGPDYTVGIASDNKHNSKDPLEIIVDKINDHIDRLTNPVAKTINDAIEKTSIPREEKDLLKDLTGALAPKPDDNLFGIIRDVQKIQKGALEFKKAKTTVEKIKKGIAMVDNGVSTIVKRAVPNGSTIVKIKDAAVGGIKYIAKKASSCLLPGTLIKLADGTDKRVEDIAAGDMVLTWNLETGSYDARPVLFNDSEELATVTVIHTIFSDGTVVDVVGEHGFFDVDLAKYIYITDDHNEEFIGHSFVKYEENGKWQAVKLEKITFEEVISKVYSPVSYGDLVIYANGMLSLPGACTGLVNFFDVNTDTMSYDKEKMEKDIEKYGLLDIDDFDGMVSEEVFEAFNGKYLGVSMAKGLTNMNKIKELISRYAPYLAQ